jgi:CheY-like chemotaxis protein
VPAIAFESPVGYPARDLRTRIVRSIGAGVGRRVLEDVRHEPRGKLVGAATRAASVSATPSSLATANPPSNNNREPGAKQEPTTILLVEDDEAVLDTFARMLRLEGYDVRTSSRPEQGLVIAELSCPRAVILDFRMPLLDGLGFLRHLRGLDGHRETPVAIVTGDYFLDEHVTRELRELGAVVLFKPMWLEQLVDLARRLVTPTAPRGST